MEQVEEILTPSYHGELCRHNGDNPDYEIACDECDYYLTCFPDWKEMLPQKEERFKLKQDIMTVHPVRLGA